MHAAGSLDAVVALLRDRLTRQRGAFLVTFVNPGSPAAAVRMPAFRDDLRRFDLVLPDGEGMVTAIRLLHRISATRVSFDSTSLAPPVFRAAAACALPVVLVGGRPGVADLAADRLRESFPGLRILASIDGYGDQDRKADAVLAHEPRIVVCAMGVGAQEAFLLRLASRGWLGCGFTCGGYFDQLAGGLQYYPGWVDRLNLRWAYRLAREPRRLWRRYLFDYGYFGRRLAIAYLRRIRGGAPSG